MPQVGTDRREPMAFCLHGVSQTDDDIYVMINAYWQNLHFEIQEGRPKDWFRIVDTHLPSPSDSRNAVCHRKNWYIKWLPDPLLYWFEQMAR
jgi:pullulanase/glycogen debranching enzyme